MDPATLDRLPRPGPLGLLIGIVRVLGVLVLLVVGCVVMLVAALVPVHVRGIRPAVYVAVGIVRVLIAITGIRLHVRGGDVLRAHRGFVFINHLAWLDPIAVMAVTPVRFLATQGIRRIPFVGWMATAMGTLYVNRGRDDSREKARDAMRTAVARSPLPVCLAPEGGIGPGPGVMPLRYGAFETAQDADADILLVALTYEPPGYAVWEHETLVGPLWRLCARTGPCEIHLSALGPAIETRPSGGTTPATLATDAEARFNAVLVGAT